MIEKILERLEALKCKDICFGMNCEECYKKFGIGVDCDEATQRLMIDKCKEIVQEVAKEYGKDTNVPSNNWIPVKNELPPMPKENPLFENKPLELYLATVKGADYPFRVFWNGKFFTDGWGKVEAIAWQPLPAPYQKGE